MVAAAGAEVAGDIGPSPSPERQAAIQAAIQATSPQAAEPTEQDQAAAFLDLTMAVNLDEAVPEPVTVTFIELVDVPRTDPTDGTPLLDEQGQPRMRRVPRPRKAVIETYVPMAIFNRMMSYRSRIQRLRAQAKDLADAAARAEAESEASAASLDMMTDMTLIVWQLSEPEMTRERYVNGLTFDKIGKLFSIFFGEKIRAQSSKA